MSGVKENVISSTLVFWVFYKETETLNPQRCGMA